MDTFLQNYWSLYLDFLKDFEKLEYQGYSLPYLCHLPSFILKDEQFISKLNDKKFIEYLNHQVNDQKEFQQVFNDFVELHKRSSVENNHGKVVIHADKLLRIPYHILRKTFNPATTIILGHKQGKVAPKIRGVRKEKQVKQINQTNKMEAKAKKLIKIRAKSLTGTNSRITIGDKRVVQREMPRYFLTNYESDTSKEIKQLQNQAKEMVESYKGHPLYEHKNFQSWFLNFIALVINQLEMTKNFLNQVSVSCIVVSTTHSYINRILAVVASEQGIPTICMQHGIISSELGYIPKIATIDAVYGNFERDWYKKIGATDKSLEIIGHPRFDRVFTTSNNTRDKFNKTLELDPNWKTLMIAVRDNQDNDKWRTLIQTISKKLNLNIVIKNYPSKTPHALTKEFSFVHSTQAYNIYNIFPYVDAVVAYSSTVGLEAMLAKKSVFILNKNFSGDTGYYTGLDKLIQTDPQKLGELIIKYFTDPQFRIQAENKQKGFLSHAYPDLSESGERLKNLINRLII